MKVITIGRDQNNEIIINDAKVSRHHCQIIQDDHNHFTVADCNSTNGTFVNGQRISGEQRLQPNDIVSVGNTRVAWQEYFIFQPPAAHPPTPRPALSPAKSRRKIWYIAASIAVLLLIGSVTTYYFWNKAMKGKEVVPEPPKTEPFDVARQVYEAKIAADQAKIAADQAEKERLTKQKEVEETKRKLSEATSAEDKAKYELELATKQEDLISLQNKEAKAKSDLASANQKIKDLEKEIQKEKERADNLGTSLDLTKEFYTQIDKLKDNAFYHSFKKVCEELKYQVPKGKSERGYIIEQFNSANNTEKQAIIAAIKKIGGQQEKAVAAEDKKAVEAVAPAPPTPPTQSDTNHKP